MKRTWPLVAAWLVLLTAALVMGAAALRLLEGEQASVRMAAVDALRAQARTVGDNITLAVEEVQARLSEQLMQTPASNSALALEQWRLGNPLVRNVFHWRRGSGLSWPPADRPLSGEEASFIRRYNSLFEGTVPWSPPVTEADGEGAAASLAPSGAARSASYESKRSLLEMSEQAVAPAAALKSAAAPVPARRAGWTPWYADDELHLLGWVESLDGEERFGLEVEMMALLSGLMAQLPPDPHRGQTFALVDGKGGTLHKTGPLDTTKAKKPTISEPVGAALPHWSIAVWADEAQLLPGEGGARTLTTLMVLIFVASIVLGGSLLLWQAYRNLVDARSKTRFVSNVSHELKTPLTTIRMYAELLNEGRVSSPEKKAHYLEVIVRESMRLTRLVNNVLDFGRLEQGRKKFTTQTLELVALVGELLEGQRPRLARAGVELHVELPLAPLVVNADRDAMDQVVLNLLDNTIKYASGGGEVAVSLSHSGGVAKLTVADRGRGVEKAHRLKIFDKFHRVDDSLTSGVAGSGLGLSIAKGLAHGMGGELVYRDRDGGGALFELTLPLAKEEKR